MTRQVKSFSNLEEARRALPRGKGPLRVLVLNRQGLPIVQYTNKGGIEKISDRDCALGTELAREVFEIVKPFHGKLPARVSFEFKEEIITVERNGPFVILIIWPKSAYRTYSANETYVRRLERTLFEELY